MRSTLSWRTIETERFAFHYPVELEEWTRAIAGRMESIDSAVTRIVGSAPAAKTHVVVDDPYETANGSAWPFLDRPAINLWASPPSPRDDIGEFRRWGEVLVAHEFTHIAHLSRPSRNTFTRRLWQVLPADIGPVAIDAPRWVIEGYATFVEGKVTGSGRPHGTWRAALLRQWALEGQLPRYDQLDAAPGFEGGEFAYLAGSAFIEWLVQRPEQNDSSLVALWRRMSAKQTRSFDEAFIGVFGESPRALYGRFSTDVTGRSIDLVRAIAAAAPINTSDTGTIVQRLALDTGDPAISADGKRIALVVRSQNMPSRVVVWGTTPEPDTGKARRDSVLVARDPEDVPARAIYPAAKKVLQSLQARGGAPYGSPRFLRDGRLLLSKNTSVGDGTLRADLYLWNPGAHDVRRITHGASLHEADPYPSGQTAVATQCRRGWCDVVLVSLDDGTIRPLLHGSPSRSYFRPRLSPNGSSFVVSVHDGRTWTLSVADSLGHLMEIASPEDDVSCYDASWSAAARIVAVCDRGGIANVATLDVVAKNWTSLTRVTGAAVAPVENPADSSIWFLSLYARGYDLRRIPSGVERPPMPAVPTSLAPAVPDPVPPNVPQFATNSVSGPRAFGFYPRSLRWLANPQIDADAITARVAAISTDIIGRSELLANAVFGDPAGWRGGSLDFMWRGFQPSLHVMGFAAEQRLSQSRSRIDQVNLDARVDGGAASLEGTEQFDTWAARYRVGASDARLWSNGDGMNQAVLSSANRTFAFADGALAWTQRGSVSHLTESLAGTYAAGTSAGTTVNRGTMSVAIAGGQRGLPPFAISAMYGRENLDAVRFERFALGGDASPLLDPALLGQRILMPVLPTGIGVGSSVFTYRATLNTAPISISYWAGSTAEGGARFADWHRVVAVNWSLFEVPEIPMAGTPAARAQFGFGESLDVPFKRRIRMYAGLVLKP